MSVMVEVLSPAFGVPAAPRSAPVKARPAPKASAPAVGIDLDRLYRDCQRQAYSVAWAYLKDEEEALDAVQEAFIKAHRSAHRFEERCRPSTWLYRIVANVCIDRLRRRRSRGQSEAYNPAEGYEFEGDFVGSLDDPHSSVENSEVRRALSDALAKMSEKHRAIIVMREVMGLTYEEIGEALDCPKGTVMSRLFHARRKLRSMLARRLDIRMAA
jgi:RNA polymerase sigma-70 factor (ECF subfamily)